MLEAVEIVCTDDQIQPLEAFGLLSQLVEKSLVVVDRRPNGFRYRFLETTYQYALEHLNRLGEIAAFWTKDASVYRQSLPGSEHQK